MAATRAFLKTVAATRQRIACWGDARMLRTAAGQSRALAVMAWFGRSSLLRNWCDTWSKSPEWPGICADTWAHLDAMLLRAASHPLSGVLWGRAAMRLLRTPSVLVPFTIIRVAIRLHHHDVLRALSTSRAGRCGGTTTTHSAPAACQSCFRALRSGTRLGCWLLDSSLQRALWRSCLPVLSARRGLWHLASLAPLGAVPGILLQYRHQLPAGRSDPAGESLLLWRLVSAGRCAPFRGSFVRSCLQAAAGACPQPFWITLFRAVLQWTAVRQRASAADLDVLELVLRAVVVPPGMRRALAAAARGAGWWAALPVILPRWEDRLTNPTSAPPF